MKNRSRIAAAWLVGTTVFALGMFLIDRLFWSYCAGVDIHRWHEVWVCWHIGEIHVVGSCVAGIIAGLLCRAHGLVVGALVALAGLAFFSVVYRYPFGTDHLFTVEYGFLLYVLPSALACVVGARLTGGVWKNAL